MRFNRRRFTYSKGMKQKLALTAAIQTNPTLLVPSTSRPMGSTR